MMKASGLVRIVRRGSGSVVTWRRAQMVLRFVQHPLRVRARQQGTRAQRGCTGARIRRRRAMRLVCGQCADPLADTSDAVSRHENQTNGRQSGQSWAPGPCYQNHLSRSPLPP
jgi:hypothetical protein